LSTRRRRPPTTILKAKVTSRRGSPSSAPRSRLPSGAQYPDRQLVPGRHSGAIGAGIDDGGWVSTSYLVTEIIVIPLSGWLAVVFSMRRYLPVNTVPLPGVLGRLRLCAEPGQMIVLRALQGFAGGVLIPLAFTIIMTLLPRAKQPIGLALFALSATFAPAIGPTIGGYLNENYGWQFIFYVNLVPGALMIAMLWSSVERTPMQLGLLKEGDWLGIVTMAIDWGRCKHFSRRATRTTGSVRRSSCGSRSSPRYRWRSSCGSSSRAGNRCSTCGCCSAEISASARSPT
jgi:MFS family permease